MITRKGRFAFFCILALTATCSVSAKGIYVSPTGNDNNNGLAAGSPFHSIAAASKLAAPGDTVYLLPGQYSETITPITSGTSGKPITYQSMGPAPAVISNVKIGIVISSQAYIVINGININGGTAPPNSNVDTFMVVQNSNNITIENCSFQYANGWSGIDVSGMYTAGGTYYAYVASGARAAGTSSYITIQNNTFDSVGSYTANYGDVVEVEFGTIQHVLIQGNTFTHGGHDLLEIDSDYSVVQNNTFNNDFRDLFGGNAGYRSFEMGGNYNVLQNNFVEHARLSGTGRIPPLASPRGSQNITRLNVMFDGAKEGVDTWCGDPSAETVVNDRIYNNTMYDLGSAGWIVWAYPGCTSEGNLVFANNLVVNDRKQPGTVPGGYNGGPNPDSDIQISVSGGSGVINLGQGPTANSIVKGNLFAPASGGPAYVTLQGADGRILLSAAASKYPQFFSHNVEAHPNFVTSAPSAKADFLLQSNSSGVGAGVFLTTAVGSGTSTQLVVDDTYYFSDGNNLIPGDIIQLQGSTQTVQIASINRASNTLTLVSPITFKAGQGVSLAYSGSAPNIGAGGITSTSAKTPLPPAGLSASQQQ